MRHFSQAVFVLCVCFMTCGGAIVRAAEPPLPAAIADVMSFHGRLLYQAHPAADPSTTIDGNLVVNSESWSLDEHSASAYVHASSQQSWIKIGSQTLVFDDPLAVDALANSWAVLLAANAGARVVRDPSGTSWTTNGGARLYLDATETKVIGAADTRSDGRESFAYDDWATVSGVRLPQSIVRMRNGVTIGSFVIDGYQVDWSPSSRQALSQFTMVHEHSLAATRNAPAVLSQSALRPFTALMALFVIALGLAAWMRRDALADHLSQRIAADPRAWRHEGINLFVSADGVLYFEGRPYRVGAAFYSRRVLVQSSSLFIRVSAPDEYRVLILARKFPIQARSTPAPRRSVAGFSLIEALAASALLATVLVAAVFPTLIVLAHADRLAAQRQLALQIAANALADEESAFAYGYTITDESAVSTVDGMQLKETVRPSAVGGLHELDVEVSDASGFTLARMVSEIGPPVPPPGAPSPAPSPPSSR
jgi:type II secretory pathway pseudopilin PulG